MSKWQRIGIGEVCDLIKGETGIAKATPGKYPLVVTGAGRKTCNTYQLNAKAVCIPLVSSTGHGKKTLNHVHYQEGKFALGTILVAVVPKDDNILSAQFLYLYLSHLKNLLLAPLMRGAANVSLPIKAIKSVEIPLPEINTQKKIVTKFNGIDFVHSDFSDEITHQQTLLKKLRQSILQEAVQGKLTKEWREENPEVEPASKLLERIRKEKEKLIKEKKIRKQKPLLPITDEKIPFESPEGWEWVRFNNLGVITGGGTPSKSKSSYWGGNIPWVSPKDMKYEKIDDTELKITEEAVNASSAKIIPVNSLLIVGRSGILKKKLPVSINSVNCTVNQDMKVLIPFFKTMSLYLQFMLQGRENFILRNRVVAQ